MLLKLKMKLISNFGLTGQKKTGTKAKSINTEVIEDSRLAELIEKGMKTKSVSRESIMNILEQK